MKVRAARAAKSWIAASLIALFALGWVPQTAAAAEKDAETEITINYDELAKYIIEGSPNYRTTYNDTQSQYDTMGDLNLEHSNYSVEYHYWERAYEQGVESGASQTTLDSYLERQANAYHNMKLIEEQLEDLDEDIASNQDTLDAAVEEELVTVQNLFLNHHKLKAQAESAEKSLAALETDKAFAEKQYELGLVSKSGLRTADQEITDKKKSLTSLAEEIDDNMSEFKRLLGIDEDKTVTLGDPPEIDLSKIDRLDYDEDLALYLANQDSIETKYDALVTAVKKDRPLYVVENAQIAYDQAKTDAKLKFDESYNALVDGYADYLSAETALSQAETDFKVMQMQRDLGLVSQKDYDAAEAELAEQRVSLEADRIGLYGQLNSYLASLVPDEEDEDEDEDAE